MKASLYTLLLFVVACTASFAQKKTVAEHYVVKPFEIAIFPEEYKDFGITGKRFTPHESDVLMAEKALATKLEKINYLLMNQTTTPVIHKNLNSYFRQYFGLINKKGQQVLLINCFWKNINQENNKRWLNERIDITEGGSFYWNIKYNLETGELYDLQVNVDL